MLDDQERARDTVEAVLSAPTVCLTFDDCARADGLEWTLDLLRDLRIRGTFFLATGYLFRPEMRLEADVERLRALWLRIATDGHEVACHGDRHLAGAAFSVEDWVEEIGRSMGDLRSLFETSDIRGFRAPKLETNLNMWPALRQVGLEYDSSVVLGPDDSVDLVDTGGVHEIPMRLMRLPEGQRRPGWTHVPPLDFNMWVSHQMTGVQFCNTLLFGARRHGLGAREPLVLAFHPDEYDGRYEKSSQMVALLDQRRWALEAALVGIQIAGVGFLTCAQALDEPLTANAKHAHDAHGR